MVSSSRLFYSFVCLLLLLLLLLSICAVSLVKHKCKCCCEVVLYIFPVLLVNWNFAHKYSRNFGSFFALYLAPLLVYKLSPLPFKSLKKKFETHTQKIEQFSVLFMNLSVVMFCISSLFLFSSSFLFLPVLFSSSLLLLNRGRNKFSAVPLHSNTLTIIYCIRYICRVSLSLSLSLSRRMYVYVCQ